MTDNRIDHRGGKRIGAGRKKESVARISVRIPQDVSDIIDEVDNKTDFVCEAVRYYYRKKCTKKDDIV